MVASNIFYTKALTKVGPLCDALLTKVKGVIERYLVDQFFVNGFYLTLA